MQASTDRHERLTVRVSGRVQGVVFARRSDEASWSARDLLVLEDARADGQAFNVGGGRPITVVGQAWAP